MSLLNDALKKAQQQRAQDAAAPPPPPATRATTPLPRIASYNPYTPPTPRPSATAAAHPRGIAHYLGLGLGAVALIGITIGITLAFLKPSPKSDERPLFPAPVQETPNATLQTPNPKPKLPAPAAAQPETAAPPPAAAQPQTPNPKLETAATAAQPETAAAPAAPAAPAAAQPQTPNSKLETLYAPRPPAPVNPAVRIQGFLDRLRVSGIRISTTGNKVILNDRLFSAQDIIDNNLGLRLVKIEPGLLTFTDAQGRTYLKPFQ